MATLTGAQGIATGKYHAAVVTNSEPWEQACLQAGKISGDLCFPIVFTPEFHLREFDSEIADMRNSVIVCITKIGHEKLRYYLKLVYFSRKSEMHHHHALVYLFILILAQNMTVFGFM